MISHTLPINVPTAAIIIIGNEVLSGQIQDLNLHYLTEILSSIGISIQKCEIIRDDEATIIKSVTDLKEKYTYVFTTGGIGPTHDDRTMPAIAKIFNRSLMRHPEIEKAFCDHYPLMDEQDQARLKMADLPTGATLLVSDLSIAPGIQIENVYVLPGVPNIMQDMMTKLIPFLQKGPPVFIKQVFCNITESRISFPLAHVQQKFKEIEIGSYPSWKPFQEKGTLLIFKGYNEFILQESFQEFIQYLENNLILFHIL